MLLVLLCDYFSPSPLNVFNWYIVVFFWQQNTISMTSTLIYQGLCSVEELWICCTRWWISFGFHIDCLCFLQETEMMTFIFFFFDSEGMKWILIFGKTWWLPSTTITIHLHLKVYISFQTCTLLKHLSFIEEQNKVHRPKHFFQSQTFIPCYGQ